jgi:hypothetical protein
VEAGIRWILSNFLFCSAFLARCKTDALQARREVLLGNKECCLLPLSLKRATKVAAAIDPLHLLESVFLSPEWQCATLSSWRLCQWSVEREEVVQAILSYPQATLPPIPPRWFSPVERALLCLQTRL